MPPKKKQKVATKSCSPSKPTSSRSTRSRTRSASVAPSTSPSKRTNNKKGKLAKTIKSEPRDEAIGKDDDEPLQVWDGEQLPHTECWVELPPLPEPKSKEDELMFFRPKSKNAWREKGNHNEYADSLVWHVDYEPVDAEPFHFAEEDLQENADALHVVAVRPRATKENKQRSRESSLARRAKAAKAIISDTAHSAPLHTTRPQPSEAGLEDMFLGSNDASSPNQRPLFLDDVSDQEDRLRNGTPAASQGRQSIKQSPTYGDGIARGSKSYRSRSSTPRASASASQAQQRKETQSSKDKDKGKHREKDRQVTSTSSNKDGRKRARSVDSDYQSKSKKKGDDVNNLRSELNEDAFARSTGARHKEEYRNKLAAFAQARKKALQERGASVSSSSEDEEEEKEEERQGVSRQRKRLGQNRRATTVSSASDTSDSDSDGSDSDSSSSSSSSSTSSSSQDSQNFIVADDEVEYDEGFGPEDEEEASPYKVSSSQSQTRDLCAKGRFDRDKDGRIRLVPISEHAAAESSSLLVAHGLGRGSRKGLEELCLDWVEWAAARVLVTWSSLCQADRERLERNRAALKSRMRSIEESVGSVAMRRQFKWYLTEYPKMEVKALFSDELDQYGTLAKNGCGVCHRKSQKAQFKITLSGQRYNQEWLSPRQKRDDDSDSDTDSSSDSDSSDTLSDRSSDGETWREQGLDHRNGPTYTFFAGQHCAQRAAVLRKLHHWEWFTMQTLAKHDSIRFIRRLLWRKHKMGRGKDGHMGCGAWEVWLAVNEMISLSGRCTWPGKEKRSEKTSELERLRRRLKSLSEQAIEVNRAR